MLRRLLPFLLVLLVPAEDARASCAPPNPRAHLKYADAAFDGRFVSSRQDGDATWFTFRVDRVFKGQLGPYVEIYQRGVSTIYFGGFQRDERVALTMNFKDGVWLSNDCQRYDPEELADAVEPIPRPPGEGRATFLVTGSFGNASAVVLNRWGRTLAYGFGGWGHAASVCPDGRRFVQLSGSSIRVVRTRDLRVLDTRGAGSTSRLHCLGRVVVRATSSGLFRGDRRIWRGVWTGMTFHGRFAYVLQNWDVVRVDVVTGRERRVTTIELPPEHEPLNAVAVSPDGRRLAIPAPNYAVRHGEPPSKVAVVHVGSGSVRMADLPPNVAYSAAVWTERDRFALLAHRMLRRGIETGASHPARFYDAELRLVGEAPGWTALPAVGVGGAVFGIVGHRVEGGTPTGFAELGRLPGSMVSAIHLLPGVEIRASRRVPRY